MIPLFFTASLAAITANCDDLSNLFACFCSKYSKGSYSFISPASFVLKLSVSNNVILSIPHSLFSIPFHVSLESFPIGVIAPVL